MPIDFHTHILPGIDDGSRNVEMSLRMLAAQREQQVDEIVATPHFYAQKDSVEEFLLRRQRSYEKLKTAMEENGFDQKLYLAAEVYYFQGIGSAGMIPKLCVEGTQTLLLEMPFGPVGFCHLCRCGETGTAPETESCPCPYERYY